MERIEGSKRTSTKLINSLFAASEETEAVHTALRLFVSSASSGSIVAGKWEKELQQRIRKHLEALTSLPLPCHDLAGRDSRDKDQKTPVQAAGGTEDGLSPQSIESNLFANIRSREQLRLFLNDVLVETKEKEKEKETWFMVDFLCEPLSAIDKDFKDEEEEKGPAQNKQKGNSLRKRPRSPLCLLKQKQKQNQNQEDSQQPAKKQTQQ